MTCDVTSDEVADAVETIFSGAFDQYTLDTDLKILKFSSVSDADGSLSIVNSDETNRISAAWFIDTVRLTDGFQASFTFSITDGSTDGLGFVVQNDAIVNTVSGAGNDLGFSGALTRYMAVGFDACNDRNEGSCTTRNVRVEIADEDGTVTVVAETDIADGDATDFVGDEVTATVQYLETTVVVQIDGTEVLSVDLEDNDLETLFGSKFAFVGFTSSNGDDGADLEGASVTVDDLSIVQMISGSRLDEDSLDTQQVEFGKVVAFTFLLVDTCNEKLTANIPDPDDTIASISAALSATDVDRDDLEPTITVLDDDATFLIAFTTPVGVESSWDLTISVDGVLAQDMPLVGLVDTNQGDNGGLDPLGIGLLIALIIILLCGVIYIVKGLYNYVKKLRENKEVIEYGKTKEKIDGIEQAITYEMNPIVAPLDKLKERLAQNEKTIQELKDGQKDAIDSKFTVDQLQEQNDKLRAEMNDLKKKQELQNVGSTPEGGGAKAFGGGKAKKDFDQEGA